MMKLLDDSLIKETLEKARVSPRRRAIHCFHESLHGLQRMLNAGYSDTYVRPHRHKDPDKLELFCIVQGKVAVIFFNDKGEIIEQAILDEKGAVRAVEIPPGTWHSFVILSPIAALYEIIDGDYDARTHKNFAPWSPEEENAKETAKYLAGLKSRVKQ